jgi:hypothetical protein
MKELKYLLCILLFLIAITVSATHNKGGIITYRNISGNTYEATVTMYTLSSSPAQDSLIELFWGDGTSDTLLRANGTGTLIGDGIKMNVYEGVHSYSGFGEYTLYIEDQNRNSGIINIPNSVNIPFYIESILEISAETTYNNSVQFTSFPIFNLTLDSFNFNSAFYDPDGDILTYELIASKAANGQDIQGYSFPPNAFIDPISGELSWHTLTSLGDYVYTMKINECRNGISVGSVILDINVTATNEIDNSQFTGLSAWQTDVSGRYAYTIEPTETIQLSISYANTSTSIESFNAFGEPFVSPNTGLFNTINNTSSSIEKQFSWTPDSTHSRCEPYVISFRGNSDFEKDISLLIYVRNPNMSYCDTMCGSTLSINDLNKLAGFIIFPNPTTYNLTIETNDKLRIFADSKEKIANCKLMIIDLQGKEIYKSHVTSYKSQIDVSGFANGVYIVQLQSQQGLTSRKFVKR